MLNELLYGRPPVLRFFVSSRMNGSPLAKERVAAASAIESLGFARAWYWERDACAGPYCSEGICIGTASTSDGLVLLLSDDLTTMTQREFEAAQQNGVPYFVFVKDGGQPDDRVRELIDSVRDHGVTVKFRNISELKTQITSALMQHLSMTHRRDIYFRRERISPTLTVGST
jgi:hypothetical protein